MTHSERCRVATLESYIILCIHCRAHTHSLTQTNGLFNETCRISWRKDWIFSSSHKCSSFKTFIFFSAFVLYTFCRRQLLFALFSSFVSLCVCFFFVWNFNFYLSHFLFNIHLNGVIEKHPVHRVYQNIQHLRRFKFYHNKITNIIQHRAVCDTQ